MKKKRYYKGDVIGEYHLGFNGLPSNLEVVKHTRLIIGHARGFVISMTGVESNKCLIVSCNSACQNNIIAAYSKDDNELGIVELAYKKTLPTKPGYWWAKYKSFKTVVYVWDRTMDYEGTDDERLSASTLQADVGPSLLRVTDPELEFLEPVAPCGGDE